MSEIEALEQAHRAAQARLGLAVALLSKARWSEVQATSPKRTGAAWADELTEAVVEARELSIRLSQAYYQLARAVETRTSMGQPLNGGNATLGSYRDSFIQELLDVDGLGRDKNTTPFHKLYSSGIGKDNSLDAIALAALMERLLDEGQDDDSTSVRVDGFAWGSNPRSESALAKIRKALIDDAVDPLVDQVADIRKQKSESTKTTTRTLDSDGQVVENREETTTARDRLARIEEAAENKGTLGAGRADELTLRAGRSNLERAQNADKMVLKYARGVGANPCHFCAMLASRGFVYASRATASSTYRDGGIRSYHPNCHCVPIARWVEESQLPKANTYFEELWQKEIANKYSGREALRAWRRLLNSMRREDVDFTINEDN